MIKKRTAGEELSCCEPARYNLQSRPRGYAFKRCPRSHIEAPVKDAFEDRGPSRDSLFSALSGCGVIVLLGGDERLRHLEDGIARVYLGTAGFGVLGRCGGQTVLR